MVFMGTTHTHTHTSFGISLFTYNKLNGLLFSPSISHLSTLFRYDWPSWPPTAYRRSDSTATPTPHLRLLIGATIRHSHVVGSNLSTEAMASPLHQPPTGNTKNGFIAGKKY